MASVVPRHLALSCLLVTFAALSSSAADPCSGDTWFVCPGSELPVCEDQRCNGVRDCADGSDEHNCECRHGDLCGDSSCVSFDKKCDGTFDCLTAIDEIDCRDGPNQQLVQEIGAERARFCVTVLRKEDKWENITIKEEILWNSKSEMTIEMYVKVFLPEQYTALATSFKFNDEKLTLGNHDVDLFYTAENKKQTLKLSFDGVPQVAQAPDTVFYTSDSNYEYVQVLAKGPLRFARNETCPIPTTTTTPTTTSQPSTPPEAPTTASPIAASSPTASSPTASPSSLTPAALTPVATATIKEDGADDGGNTLQPSENQKTIVLWCVVGGALLLVVVSLLVVGYCVCCRRKAKRLSYQEQIRWMDSDVDGNNYATTYS